MNIPSAAPSDVRPRAASPRPVARRRSLLAGLAVVGAAALLVGCANYRLGTGGDPGFRSVYVEPVTNKTLVPQAQAIVSTHVREAFARDGRVQLANSAAGADATLVIVISEYRREIAAVREGDTGLARKFNVTLGVTATLRDNRTTRPIFENRPVNAVREVFTDSGLLQSEYQTIPLLAEALAKKVVHTSLDVW